MVKKQQSKAKDLSGTLIKLGIVLVLFVISSFVFTRFDITEEKRHSLTPSTQEMLSELDDVVYVKCYLKGDHPAEFKQLARAIQEKLDEMSLHAGNNLQYEFVNPSESSDQKTRNEVYQKLTEDGLKYTSIEIVTKDARIEKIIFPGALVTYKGKTLALQILKGGYQTPGEVMMSNAINNLEYELSHIIRKIQKDEIQNIAFIEGHGELPPPFVADISNVLSETYDVERVKIDGKLSSLFSNVAETSFWQMNYDLLIIADPDSAFSDQDKYLLDQFIMRGGKIIWMIDPLVASRDSMRNTTQFFAITKELDLDAQLFNYGVRLNKDLVIDENCGQIDVQTGQLGDQVKIDILDWVFNPLAIPRINHPIVNNMEQVNLDFVSSMDTIPKKNIKKTVLLSSSENSRVYKTPVRVNINAVRMEHDFDNKSEPDLIMGVLLEGEFNSAFADRIAPVYKRQKGIMPNKEKSVSTSMLVVSDGDIAKNLVELKRGIIYPLNFDRYKRREIYGNKEFILNAVNYMLNEQGLISLRTRSIKLRKLNANIDQKDEGIIKAANVSLPLVIVAFIGLIVFFIRKRKYL